MNLGSACPNAFSGPASCFFESCRPDAVDGRPLDVIARHDFRAYDKSVCDGKTRRALLWLSVPFERGNHTRSNGGGATARLTTVAEGPADAQEYRHETRLAQPYVRLPQARHAANFMPSP